jgi:hypothetical protein
MLTERKSTKIRDIIQGYFVQVQCVTGCANPSVHMKTFKKKADKSRPYFLQQVISMFGIVHCV